MNKKELLKEIDEAGDTLVEIKKLLNVTIKQLQDLQKFIGGDIDD